MAEPSGKTLLIISGGIEAADAARRAKEMGHTVVVSDRDPNAPGFAFADSCLIADVYGASETAAAAERYSRKIRKIDGVICVAADAPVTAATVAQRLRIPGLPVHVAELACDKLAMKKCFRSAGVAVPWFAEIPRRRNCSASPSNAAAILSSSRWTAAAAAGCSGWRRSRIWVPHSCWRGPIHPPSG